MSLLEIADATPASRDRYVDFLRAVSIMVVVLGHWLIAIIYWRNGEVSGQNALDVVPGLWAATWILQVMPIFFFVGGFSNLVTMDAVDRRGGGYAQFIHGRVRRLMRPTIVFLAVWIPIAAGVDLVTGVGDDVLQSAGTLLTRPLWFLGIYMIMIAFAPAMAGLHRAHRAVTLAGMIAGAILVDVAAVGFDIPYVGYLNFAFVWLFVHQLGFFYADGSLSRIGRGYYWALAAGGLAVLLALTASGIYSPSMVGLQNERSNTNPPTIAIVALTLWQVGLVMLLRQGFTRWLSRRRVWAAVIGLNAVIMTMFLWHQTAMILTVGAIYPLGFPQPRAGTATWWLLRPVWVALLATTLSALVMLLGRFERSRREDREAMLGGVRWFPALVAAAGTTHVLIGVLGFAVSGLDGFASPRGDLLVMFGVNPLLNTIHLLLGGTLLSASIGDPARARARVLAAVVSFGALSIAGIFLPDAPSANLLALNLPDVFLHATTALLLFAGMVMAPGRTGNTPINPAKRLPLG